MVLNMLISKSEYVYISNLTVFIFVAVITKSLVSLVLPFITSHLSNFFPTIFTVTPKF